ncbi:PspA/IM30 family protein [Alkalihalobacillus sp. 1P02AB]|uniref:PspA/IM30 family protein n=1 Tax=Alkalihalobacillus sp. 1P02AB TaxID=3132260 RepID=UPI0039A4E81C
MAFARIRRFLSASIHEGLDKVEDPIVMVKQFMREMKEEIVKMEQAIDKQERLQFTLNRDKETAEAIVQKRSQQAKAAVDVGEEELAKKALLSKKEAYEQAIRYEQLISKSEEHMMELKQNIEQLQKKYIQLRDKKMELTLRVQAAKANEELKRSIQRHSIRRVDEGFEKIEDQMLEMEWKHKTPSTRSFENEQMIYDAEIEQELKQLKEQKQA